jgi:hypothetical protein
MKIQILGCILLTVIALVLTKLLIDKNEASTQQENLSHSSQSSYTATNPAPPKEPIEK